MFFSLLVTIEDGLTMDIRELLNHFNAEPCKPFLLIYDILDFHLRALPSIFLPSNNFFEIIDARPPLKLAICI